MTGPAQPPTADPVQAGGQAVLRLLQPSREGAQAHMQEQGLDLTMGLHRHPHRLVPPPSPLGQALEQLARGLVLVLVHMALNKLPVITHSSHSNILAKATKTGSGMACCFACKPQLVC